MVCANQSESVRATWNASIGASGGMQIVDLPGDSLLIPCYFGLFFRIANSYAGPRGNEKFRCFFR